MNLSSSDEVALVATIEIRYKANRGMYSDGFSRMLTNDEMAKLDEKTFREHEVSVANICDWASSYNDVKVSFTTEEEE